MAYVYRLHQPQQRLPQLVLGEILRNTRHVLWGPCKDVPILTEEIDELAFLFAVEVCAYDSVPLWVLRIQGYLLCLFGWLERTLSFPEWLANPVLVLKKNKQWRMCIDYMSLNKACPKDPFALPRIDQEGIFFVSLAGLNEPSASDSWGLGDISGCLPAIATTRSRSRFSAAITRDSASRLLSAAHQTPRSRKLRAHSSRQKKQRRYPWTRSTRRGTLS